MQAVFNLSQGCFPQVHLKNIWEYILSSLDIKLCLGSPQADRALLTPAVPEMQLGPFGGPFPVTYILPHCSHRQLKVRYL